MVDYLMIISKFAAEFNLLDNGGKSRASKTK